MNRSELIEQVAAGAEPDFLFFWGHTPAPGHAVGKWVLSQWWPVEFTVDGTGYLHAEHRYEIVVRASTAKFGQHAELREFLVATGGKVLVEAAPRDVIWGIGLGADNPRAQDPAQWRGRNLLGFALMDARAALS